MPYSELVKNFNKIRRYMRDFYVYGFKSREDFDAKSTRTYDDERRRIESWLSDYMQFRQTTDGKIVSISIDSRSGKHNPFYKAWKTKSFTDGDITLQLPLRLRRAGSHSPRSSSGSMTIFPSSRGAGLLTNRRSERN